jgi:hypothetical protein
MICLQRLTIITDRLARGQIEFVRMKRTNHFSSPDDSVGQRPVTMRASRLDGIDTAIASAKYGNQFPEYFILPPFTQRNALDRTKIDGVHNGRHFHLKSQVEHPLIL